MFSRPFPGDISANPITNSLYTYTSPYSVRATPLEPGFILLEGDFMTLLDGTDFLLLGN